MSGKRPPKGKGRINKENRQARITMSKTGKRVKKGRVNIGIKHKCESSNLNIYTEASTRSI